MSNSSNTTEQFNSDPNKAIDFIKREAIYLIDTIEDFGLDSINSIENNIQCEKQRNLFMENINDLTINLIDLVVIETTTLIKELSKP